MSDLSGATLVNTPPNPQIPTLADYQAAVAGLGPWGPLAGLPNKPTEAQVLTAARQMFPGYDSWTPEQQNYAHEIARINWYANNNTPKGGAPQTPSQLVPGTTAVPNLALDAIARQKFGSDAWMLNIPELRVILETAAAQGTQQADLESQVRATQWWQTTTQSQQEFSQLQATSPDELNFGAQGSQASRNLAHVEQLAAAGGIYLDIPTMQKIALNTMEFQWSDDLIKQALASQVQYNPSAGLGLQYNAPSVENQLKSVNNDYMLANPDPATAKWWTQQLIAGTQTIAQYKAVLQSQAASKYTWAAPQLNQGLTMQAITSSLRSQAAQLMEQDPSQIDFVNNPTYSKILDYVPPGDTVHRAMTDSEAANYLRGTSQWGYTQQARDLAGTWAANLTKTFGKVAA